MTERGHFVYRVLAADGALLYVGCTKDVAARMYQHGIEARWHMSISVRADGPFPKGEALALEKQAIRDEQPRHNRQHTGRYVPQVRAFRLDGPTVRGLREERGLTLDAFATAIGCSKGYLSRLERGLRLGTPATTKRIADHLGVALSALLERRDVAA